MSTYDNEPPTGLHISFRDHNEADLWAAKGAKGHVDEWADTAHVVWSEVIGLCGFWYGALGWIPSYKK